jgi:hypothetical protein
MNFNNLIGLAALIVAILGIPITFVLARRTRLRPELRSAIDLDQILKSDDRLFDLGLSMTLGEREITSICRTRIALWNHKGDTIRSSDDLQSDPLRVQLTAGDEALQARVLSTSRKQIGFTVGIDADSSVVQISFDFLDSGDGAIIEVIHQEPSNPMVLGTIQGCNIRKPKKLDLSARALTAVSERSKVRRFWGFMPRNVKPAFLIFVLLLSITIGQVLFTILRQEHEPSHLINIYHYNLKTLQGQINFAKAVSKTKSFNSAQNGIGNMLPNLLYVAFGLVLLASAFIFGSRRGIPYSITVYRMVADDDTIGMKEKKKVLPDSP